jgi:nucleoside-diphosphate-sugar epimerase
VTRVAVTGGSGKLGHAVLEDLTGHGYEVLNLDRVPQSDVSIPFTRVDLTDFGQTVAGLFSVDDRHSGVDAVVHLAAIPGPGLAPNLGDLQRVHRGPGGGDHRHRLGLQ